MLAIALSVMPIIACDSRLLTPTSNLSALWSWARKNTQIVYHPGMHCTHFVGERSTEIRRRGNKEGKTIVARSYFGVLENKYRICLIIFPFLW